MLTSIGWCARTSAYVVFSVLLFFAASAPDALAAPAFVPGYTSIMTSMEATPQWKRLVSSNSFRPDRADVPWQALITELSDKHPLRQLDGVNRYFNRVPYAEDSANYGTPDHWASYDEFLRRDAGDCEDYAIAKYAALVSMGWSVDDLLIVVVRDHKYSIYHAALAAKFEGQWYLLDNRASRIMTPSDVPFYQPVYALNENQLFVFVRT